MSRRDERLWRFLDGRASREDIAALEDEARKDGSLRTEVEQGQAIVEGLEELPYDAPPVDLVGLAERRLASSPARVAPRARWPWAVGLAAALAVLLAVVSLRTPAADPPPVLELVVLGVQGEAWVTGTAGKQALKGGERLAVGARVETGVDARASFGADGVLSVSLDDATAVDLLLVGSTETRLHAVRGVVRARAQTGEVQLVLGASGATARTRHGELGALVAETHAAVASQAGEVIVSQSAVETKLASGQQVVSQGGQLGAPSAVSAALALEVAPLEPLAPGTQRIRLVGQTSPGAAVTIDGVPVAADASGRFIHEMDVPGLTHVVVHTRDALQRRRELQVALSRRRDRPAPREPATPLETDWEWEKPKKG